ncbi:alpha/beta hydrolase [Thalassospira alkalitolerans]|uniref:alpha/beta hydrolase n=1 Tax=Thalassospira alkalitolerans TaxID=1293890 RepID=UPI003AA82722
MRFPIFKLALCSIALFGSALAKPAQATDLARDTIGQYILHSEILGRDMRLLVWQPDQTAPKNGFPVIYSFDGAESIGLFAELATAFGPLGARYKLSPPVIVGIAEMPGFGSNDQRTYDFTPPAKDYNLPERPNQRPWPKLGGGDIYLRAVIDEIKPFVTANLPVDTTRETLFGHSLGGLMTLHALATDPDAFDGYVAGSPSLWMNTPQRFSEIDALLDNPDFTPTHPIALTIGVGSEEARLGTWEKDTSPESRARRLAWKQNNNMVEYAKDMADLIKGKAGNRIALQFTVFDGEDHLTAKAIAMNRAVKQAMTP